MTVTISNALITSAASANTPQTTSYTTPANSKHFICVTDMDNSNTSGNNIECTTRTFDGVSMGTAVARIASDAGGTGQLKNAYAVKDPTIATVNVVTTHTASSHHKEMFSIVSSNNVEMAVSPVSYGLGTSINVTVTTKVGDLVVYSVSLNNVLPTGINASTTPPYDGQTLVVGGGDVNQGARIFTKVATSTSTSAAWSAGFSARWSVVAFIFTEGSAAITSFNGGNPVTAGQTSIPVQATGFTGKPTAVTATYESDTKAISATIGAGTATDFVIDIQDRVNGEDWPLNGTSVTFTFTYGSELASVARTLVKKADETVYTFTGAITSDPATLTYWLTQDGFTVEGGEHAYSQPAPTASMPTPNLVLTPDGGGTVFEACTFTSWFRPAAGTTGAGNVYEYEWVISESGISVVGRRRMPSSAIGYGIGI